MRDTYRGLFFVLIIACVILAIIFAIMDAKLAQVWADGSNRAVLVIDAGHGGEDGGAVCGELVESAINLSIAQRLARLSELLGIDYRMTRCSEDIDYPAELKTTAARKVYDQKRRLALTNSLSSCVLLSIHQNKYPSASPRGPQCFFSETTGSRELAEQIQSAMSATLFPENRRLAVEIPDSIYLMKNVSCPAVLTECGFLSNPIESKLLAEGKYQTKLALCMISSYCIYIENTFPS